MKEELQMGVIRALYGGERPPVLYSRLQAESEQRSVSTGQSVVRKCGTGLPKTHIKCGTGLPKTHIKCGTGLPKTHIKCGTGLPKTHIKCGTGLPKTHTSTQYRQRVTHKQGNTMPDIGVLKEVMLNYVWKSPIICSEHVTE
jgi:hypothetical protein